ncbi:LCP family protein [Streptomyces sp. NPDC055808]|uniref:LCP family protein n=1 Tax=Streptomyces sp. NPDC001828 TaxID=3364615 RepID=UPI0036AD231C
MNDRQYDPYAPQVQLVGYDEYGRPVYQQVPPQQQAYDPYAQPQEPQQQQQQPGYGYDQTYVPQQPTYDPYAQQPPPQPPQQSQPDQQAQHAQQAQQHQQFTETQQFPQQGYGQDYGTARQPAVQEPVAADPEPQGAPVVPQQRREGQGAGGERGAGAEEFAFTEEPDEDSEDVIDWLKFTESRSERREEAKRRGRKRVVALVVALVLVVVGGVGYLWSAGKLPGLSSSSDAKKDGATPVGAQKRDVIAVHLHNTKAGGTSTALLVNNVTTKQGTTVLLPNALAITDDDGNRTTLGKSVDSDGSQGTRDSLSNLLGAKITGTWRLDTPYLENLVDLVGNIDINTDTDVPGAKQGGDPLVKKGDEQTLTGQMAVAYATYRGPGEAETKQLQRFGTVMYGVLRKISDDPKAATITVQTLAQILDPSLPESDLGASLAKLAEHAKIGAYKTALLPVQPDGTLSQQAADSVVKDVLGGKLGGGADQGSSLRVGLKNASGNSKAAESARIALVNGGYTFIDAGSAGTQAASQVLYGDEAKKANAVEVAKTLGLPDSAVKQGGAAANADVSVVIGKDYKAPK